MKRFYETKLFLTSQPERSGLELCEIITSIMKGGVYS